MVCLASQAKAAASTHWGSTLRLRWFVLCRGVVVQVLASVRYCVCRLRKQTAVLRRRFKFEADAVNSQLE